MLKLVKTFHNKQFLFFLLTSGLAALTNFFSRILLGLWLSYPLSIVLAYIIGMLIAFSLCRIFVFKESSNKLSQQILFFCLVNVVGILLTLAVSLLLAGYVLTFIHDRFLREEVAHFFGICAPAFSSYVGHKHFSFQ